MTGRCRLSANHDAVSSSGAALVVVLGFRRAVRAIRVAAAVSATVELDTGTGTGDTVAFASAAGRRAGDGAWGTAVAAAGAERWNIRFDIGVGVALLFGGIVFDLGSGEFGSELLQSRVLELFMADLAGFLGLVRSWRDDLRLVEGTALGYTAVRGDAAGVTGGLGRGGGGFGGLASVGDVEDVQLAAGGGLGDGLASWIVGDVVAVDDVIVPVSLALLEGLALEAEGAFPAAYFHRVLGKRELAIVVVPGAEQMDGLDVGRGTESEVKLNGGHYVVVLFDKCVVSGGIVITRIGNARLFRKSC